jgi:hypothetical protein
LPLGLLLAQCHYHRRETGNHMSAIRNRSSVSLARAVNPHALTNLCIDDYVSLQWHLCRIHGRLVVTPQSPRSILCLAKDTVCLYHDLKNNVMKRDAWSRHFPLPQSPLGDRFLRERSIGYPTHSTTCHVGFHNEKRGSYRWNTLYSVSVTITRHWMSGS